MTQTKGYFVNLTATLLIISAVVAGLLGLTNGVTAEKISAINQEKTAASMEQVLPADSYTPVECDLEGVAAAYQAGDQGYVIEVTPSGFGGTIDMVVGVKADGTVAGVEIISMSETSGLGANASKDSFRSQFVGKSGDLAVTKDGGDIDALTGATITSRAVTQGVNTALQAAAALMG